MPTIEANGQKLYYEEHGEGEPLLCVMGLAADTLTWALQVPAFSERHRTVIFDNRDVGQSSMADGAYEIADMAADALALADGLELDTFHLLGVSMGGAIAQEMALAARTGCERSRWRSPGPRAAPGPASSARCGARAVQKQTREEHVDELMLLNLSEEFFENAEAVTWLRGLMLDEPAPPAARGLRPPARRLIPPRHPRPARLPVDARARDRCRAGHPGAGLEVPGASPS